jgi:hypothetical protein
MLITEDKQIHRKADLLSIADKVFTLLYAYSFPHRVNFGGLIEAGIMADVNSIPRGFGIISKDNFDLILKLTQSNESIVVD